MSLYYTGILRVMCSKISNNKLRMRRDSRSQTFMVTNVHPTGRTIGAGSYGSVEEVIIPGAICAAKGMPGISLENVD